MRTVGRFLLSLLVVGSVVSGLAQGQPGPPGWNRALTRAFEPFEGFSSVADWRILDRSGKETVRLPIGFAKLKEQLRLEIDLTQMKSAELKPQTLAVLKQLGMDRMVVVVTPSRGQMQMIYPALNSYVEMPLPDEGGGSGKAGKPVVTRLGEEKIDGRACVKQKSVVSAAGGQKVETIEWIAPDMRNFPLQVQLQDKETSVVLKCASVQLTLPDARQFQPPTNFMKYTDVTRLMEDSAKRLMAGTAPPGAAKPSPGTNRPSTQPVRPQVSSTNRPPSQPSGTRSTGSTTNRTTTTNRTAAPTRPR